MILDGKLIPLQCCSSNPNPECLPISVPVDGPYIPTLDCISYSRTAPAPHPYCRLGPREQANQATSYLDGSVFYGNTIHSTKALRTFKAGEFLNSTFLMFASKNPNNH